MDELQPTERLTEEDVIQAERAARIYAASPQIVVGELVEGPPTVAPELMPKDGTKTSSFYVFLATLIVGGLFTWLSRRGYVSPEVEAQRPWLVQLIAEVLPVAWIAVVGWMGKNFMKGRREVARRKLEAINTLAAKR